MQQRIAVSGSRSVAAAVASSPTNACLPLMEGDSRARTPHRSTTPGRPRLDSHRPSAAVPHRRHAAQAFACCSAPDPVALLAAVQPPFAGSVARIKMPGISAQQTPEESMPTQGNNSSGGSIAEAQTHGVTGEGVGEKEQRLRQQLEGQGLSALQRQAAQCGVEPADVDGALDTACPKSALIDLLISRPLMSPSSTSPGAVPIEEQRTRQQLESMKLTALQKRGVAAGLTDGQMEGAVDSVDPRAALIELLMSQPAALAFATAAPKEVRPAARREAHLTQQRKATSLSAELEHMTPSQLRKRAVAEGVKEEQIEAAEDAESPKREMI
eukprot:COSAG01_NODE_1498_length_10117_cov_19.035536_1_plen_326_part_10